MDKLSNNTKGNLSSSQEESATREARTKSSSTVDSESESQENSQVLAQQPALGVSKPLDYVVVPQNKPSMVGSSLKSDCATDVSQLN